MISMTGFGRAQHAGDGHTLVVEVRSVNHRNLDVKVRGRNLSAGIEAEVVRAVRATIGRGSVQVSIDETSDTADESASELGGLSTGRIRAAHKVLEQLRRELAVPAPVDLATVAGFLRLEQGRERRSEAALAWPALQPAMTEALAALDRSRRQEGEALQTELRQRAGRLDQLADQLRERTAGIPARAARRLQERLEAALGGNGAPLIDPARLAQEVALLADRLDVSEELARLEVHRARLREMLAVRAAGEGSAREGIAREGIGRPLEFLLQEIGRELNTLGTKSQDAEVSALVISAKAELEKIREQAQNIE